MKINGSPLSESTFPLLLQTRGSRYLREAMLTEKPVLHYLLEGVVGGGKPHREVPGQNPEGFNFQLRQNPSSFPTEDLQSKPCSGEEGASPQM